VGPSSSPRAHGDADRGEQAALLLKRLAAVFRTCALYSPQHPHTTEGVAHFIDLADRYLERHGPLALQVFRSSFRFNFEQTERSDEQVAPLMAGLHASGARRLSVLPGVDASEIQTLLEVLAMPAATIRQFGGIERALQERSVPHVLLQEVAGPKDEPPSVDEPAELRDRAQAILRVFMAAVRNTRMYPAGHPAVERAVRDLWAALSPALSDRGDVQYDIRQDAVFYQMKLLDMNAVFATEFAADCVARDIGRLTFLPDLTKDELTQVVWLFARDPETLIVEGGVSEALRAWKVLHVRVGPLR